MRGSADPSSNDNIVNTADTNHSNALLLAQHCHGNQNDWQQQFW